MTDHIKTAVEIIERMKAARAARYACEKCHRIDYNKAGEFYRTSLLDAHSARGPGGTAHYMNERGYDEDFERAGFVRRCDECKDNMLREKVEALEAKYQGVNESIDDLEKRFLAALRRIEQLERDRAVFK